MKPQASIKKVTLGNDSSFVITKEENGTSEEVMQQFNDYQQALEFILEQGWQLKRERPAGSLHVDTRFLKP